MTMTQTRAKHILSLLEDIRQGTDPALMQGGLYAGAGIFAGVTGMSIASGVKHAKQTTLHKIHQAGLGKEHQRAKGQLSSMRKKHAMTLGSNSGLGLRIKAQKRRIQDIENRGLERYHKGLIVNPPSEEPKQG